MIRFKFIEKRERNKKMILNNIYEKFVEHTGLTDSMYKMAFIQIGDVLRYIQDLKWIRLKYTIADENYSHDFLADEDVPLFVVEIIQNLFENFYSFPENSNIELELEYKGIPYKITCINDEVEIPPDLSFIDEYSLFRFFLVTRKVFDIFHEFDYLFDYTNEFRTKVHKMYSPLKEKFENQTGKEEIDKGNISENKISASNTLIENLKKSRNDILKKLDLIMDDKSKCSQDKIEVLKVVKSKKGFELERKNLLSEFDILKEDYDKDKKTLNKIIDLIAEIDSQLETLALSEDNVDKSEQEYLKDRKVIFEKQKNELMETLNSTKSLMDAVEVRAKNVNDHIRKIQKYNMNDVDVLAGKIYDLDKSYKETYVSLITIENEIKQQSLKVNIDNVHIAKEKPDNESLNKMDNQKIVDHLSSPQQPTSITVVINYLRYFYSYYVSKASVELMDVYKDFETATIQALACKLVLVRCFGIYYHNIFSSIKFIDNRIAKVINVNGQEL